MPWEGERTRLKNHDGVRESESLWKLSVKTVLDNDRQLGPRLEDKSKIKPSTALPWKESESTNCSIFVAAKNARSLSRFTTKRTE